MSVVEPFKDIEVVNKRTYTKQPGDIYVGRPSRWGNPFVGEPRIVIIEKFRTWIEERPYLIKELAALNPKRLVCWCAPQPCHADVLKELLIAYDWADRVGRLEPEYDFIKKENK